ncbi:MAG: hypothetical protein M1309_06595 [Actinobacteria bacterium]|nr:hypothetical protein [Actinomycetota bacterium]
MRNRPEGQVLRRLPQDSPSCWRLPSMCLAIMAAALSGSSSTATRPPVSPSTTWVSTRVTSSLPVTGGTGDR